MYIVEGKIISAELFLRQFFCNLSKCQGACCWEGDFGAPVLESEVAEMKAALPIIQPILSKTSQEIISREGVAPLGPPKNKPVTPLHREGACAYLFRDTDGISKCAFEVKYAAGETEFKKPISCHLYPIRVSIDPTTGMEKLEYDQWDICSAACSLGEELKVPVFRFAKDALTRAYGPEFYEQLEELYKAYFTQRSQV